MRESKSKEIRIKTCPQPNVTFACVLVHNDGDGKQGAIARILVKHVRIGLQLNRHLDCSRSTMCTPVFHPDMP